MSKMRIAVIQMNSTADSPEEIVSQVRARLEKIQGGISLVILPELWTVSRYDETLPGKAGYSIVALEFLSSWARERFCAVHCGSLPWTEGGKLVNRSFFVAENGVAVASYDKAHLIPMMNETSFFSPGEGASLFLWNGIVWGNAICYDIRFPEYIRGIALAGARALLVPAAWPQARISHWRTLLQARSIENQVFTIGCNRCGPAGDILFGGHSMVIAPDGAILAEAGDRDETVVAEIDLAEVERARKSFPVLQSRRKHLYSIVSSI